MEKRINLGFVLGFIGGFINVLFALFSAYALAANISHSDSSMLFSGTAFSVVVIIVLLLVNFTGACICRNNLAAGRGLMYVTGLILLILFIGSLSNLISGPPKAYTTGIPAYIIAFFAVMIAAQGLSVAAAAVLSVPTGKEQAPEYGSVLDVFRQDDVKGNVKNEFQAVHRLYGLSDEVSKAETGEETDTKPIDT